MDYAEQLTKPEWKYTRQRIIDRDFGMCQGCMSGKNLHVHHKYYIEGHMAWDYPDSALITLCDECHKWEHENNVIPIRQGEDVFSRAGRVISDVVRGIYGLMGKENG